MHLRVHSYSAIYTYSYNYSICTDRICSLYCSLSEVDAGNSGWPKAETAPGNTCAGGKEMMAKLILLGALTSTGLQNYKLRHLRVVVLHAFSGWLSYYNHYNAQPKVPRCTTTTSLYVWTRCWNL